MKPAPYRVPFFFFGLVCALLFATGLNSNGGDKPAAQEEAVNFSQHIAPIVFENCAGCHRTGEAAPFKLTDYASVKRRARTIQRVVDDRYMPPWHADEGWGNFRNPRRLTGNQIELISTWVKNGAPEGNPDLTPKLPDFPEGWSLGNPDLVVEMEAPFEVYAEGKDIYRYFALPLDLKEDHWVRAVEVRPSARAVVHHVLFFLDSSGAARKLDARDDTPGFRRRAFRPSGSLGGWAVGGSPPELGSGYALPLPAGSDLVLQTHFHPSGKVEREQTKVGIYFAPGGPPEKPLLEFQVPPRFGATTGLNVAPGEKNFELRDHIIVPEDLDLITAWGHAHQICTSIQAVATLPGGSKKKLIRVGDWDFNWQEQYVYAEPVRLPKGTRIDALITYDNSADNPVNPNHPPRRIFWGEQSDDEMGSVIFQCVAAKKANHASLDRGLRLQRTASALRFAKDIRTGVRRKVVLKLDADGDDRVSLAETPKEHHGVFEKLDRDEDGYVTVTEIDAGASILDRANRKSRTGR